LPSDSGAGDAGPEIVLIAAVGENDVIGTEGELPWSLPEDLNRFRRLTVGKPIIMGRGTFESIGRPLPERTNIVLTRDADYAGSGIVTASSPHEALDRARQAPGGDTAICVIGGGQVYRLFLDMADRMELTRVAVSPLGDTHFPQWSQEQWQLIAEVSRPGPPSHTFQTWRRLGSKDYEGTPVTQ